MALIKCPECGKEVSTNADTCPNCGTPLAGGKAHKAKASSYVTNTSNKRRKTALLMCIFGGWFGLHHYYVGNIGKGILYTFTAGLLCIGWIIDIFKILLGTFKDNTGVPLRG